jgi:hypothetical protein
MSAWHFYRLSDGIFTGASYSGRAAHLALNIPDGCGAAFGDIDHLAQRVDVSLSVVDDFGNAVPVVVDHVPPPPADDDARIWEWDPVSKRHVARATLAAARLAAKDSIDAAAGAARLRYITDVPGQQAVYIRKLAEATSYLQGGGAGEPPPYIAAEGRATGLSPLEAAQRIKDIASQWDNVLSPAIEEVRIAAKVAIDAESLTTEAEVVVVRDAALAALRQI